MARKPEPEPAAATPPAPPPPTPEPVPEPAALDVSAVAVAVVEMLRAEGLVLAAPASPPLLSVDELAPHAEEGELVTVPPGFTVRGPAGFVRGGARVALPRSHPAAVKARELAGRKGA